MFNVGQRTAVVGVFRLAGYDGPLMVAPVVSEDERAFIVPSGALANSRDRRVIEQVVGQLLHRKCFIVEQSDSWPTTIPFE
jgi:hypothetical protein